ncbi:MAG: putative phosphatase YwpJ [Planctomycetes bacterium ADurb.Bin126]|nr:MAG: putative phosphatase YwpJ [Planctomycetes bacterium ADurb.Bin126]
MNERIVVFVDNEGCLTPGTLFGYDLMGLQKVRELLGKHTRFAVVPCTGRSAPYTEALAQCLGIQNVSYPLIVEGGAALYEVAAKRLIPLKPSDELNYLDGALPRGGWDLELGKYHCRSYYPGEGVRLEDLLPRIRSIVLDHQLALDVTSSSAAVDVTPRGCSKGDAVTQWCMRMGVPLASTVGIGDQANDLSFLTRVGLPCAPANATQAVKDIARYVSPYPDVAGVLDILNRLKDGALRR